MGSEMRADINLQTIRDIGRADPTHLSSALAERMHGSTTFAVASAAPLSAGLDGTPIVPADVVMAQPSSDRTKKRDSSESAKLKYTPFAAKGGASLTSPPK